MHPTPAPVGKTPAPAAEPDSADAQNKTLIAVVAIAAALVLAVVLLGAARMISGSDDPAVATAPASSAEQDDSDAESARTSANERRAKRAVVATLNRYESAYTNQDSGRLTSVFTNGVSRFGNVAGSCQWSYGIDDVISAAASNMNGEAYELVGLSTGKVNLIGGDRPSKATVNSKYAFGGGQPARIRFVLVPKNGGWRVSKVDAFCGSHQPY